MVQDPKKMMLSDKDVASAQKAFEASEAEFLDPSKKRANVVGMGIGVKWKNGEPTGEPALVTLVSQKVEPALVSRADRIPPKLQDIQTDVLAVGEPIAGGGPHLEAGVQALTRRLRPAQGGWSVGHPQITAGTIATCVYDIQPGGGVTPPRHGIGIPSRYYILSNNHVLANTNSANLGDPIVQPGQLDGGTLPADRIARLSRFVPIQLDPPLPRNQHNNIIDAAIAEGEFHDLDREIYWSGYVRGWRRKADVRVGTLIKKTGRTTNFTLGRITAINATVDINFRQFGFARFRDQIITTSMSAGGDSGSLILTLDNVAIGLLFAGSSVSTIINHIEHVRSLLRVEVAEEIL